MRSVAMAVYQGMPYLIEQLDSIMVQLQPDDELVISDDGSTDGSWPYLQSVADRDPRVRLLQHNARCGVVANFAYALAHCRGDLIFLSDQDDVWLPGRLERLSNLFAADDRLVLLQADAEMIDAAGRTIQASFFAWRGCRTGFWSNLYKNTYQGCSLCFRHSLLAAALPFPDGIPMHDVWLGLIAERTGRVLKLPEVWTRYRRHDRNSSGQLPSRSVQIIRWRLCLLLAWCTRIIRIRLSQICHRKNTASRS